jgi:hypothetical protein
MKKISHDRLRKIERAIRIVARDRTLAGVTKAAKIVGEDTAKVVLIFVAMVNPDPQSLDPIQTDKKVRMILEGHRLLKK